MVQVISCLINPILNNIIIINMRRSVQDTFQSMGQPHASAPYHSTSLMQAAYTPALLLNGMCLFISSLSISLHLLHSAETLIRTALSTSPHNPKHLQGNRTDLPPPLIACYMNSLKR